VTGEIALSMGNGGGGALAVGDSKGTLGIDSAAAGGGGGGPLW